MLKSFSEEFREARVELDRLLDSYMGMQKLGEEIKKEFDLPQLKTDLLALPEQIKKTQIVALQKKAELSEFEQMMKQRESEILFEINNESGPNGKAKFPNDPARKAELTIRLGKDEKYLALKVNRSAIEFKVWEFEAEVDKLCKEFRAKEAIKDLVCAEIKLYTK